MADNEFGLAPGAGGDYTAMEAREKASDRTYNSVIRSPAAKAGRMVGKMAAESMSPPSPPQEAPEVDDAS